MPRDRITPRSPPPLGALVSDTEKGAKGSRLAAVRCSPTEVGSSSLFAYGMTTRAAFPRSLRHQTTVHGERVTRHERRRLRAQPNGSLCDFLWRSHPAHGLQIDELLFRDLVLAGDSIDHLGVDDAWTNGVYANAALRILQRGSLGESYHAVLAGDVCGEIGEPDQTSRGRHVDNAATASLP